MTPEPFYADGNSTLYRGDSLRVLQCLADASVDAVVTDPPYSSGGQYRGDRMIRTSAKYLGNGRPEPLPDFAGDNRDQRAFGYWCALWMGEARRVTVQGGVLAVATDWRQMPTVTDAIQAGGWTWRGVLAWAKPDARPQLGRYRQACEFFVWGTNGPREIVGDSLPGFWVEIAPRERSHQTQKPLKVFRDLVRVAPPGGLVLDPFAGSSTTGVACAAEGRRYIGIEMSETYLKVSRERLAGATIAGAHPAQTLFAAHENAPEPPPGVEL